MFARGHRSAALQCLGCRAQIRTGERNIASRPAAVELRVICEPPITIEQKEIRRTACRIRLRHLFRLVIQIRKVKPLSVAIRVIAEGESSG